MTGISEGGLVSGTGNALTARGGEHAAKGQPLIGRSWLLPGRNTYTVFVNFQIFQEKQEI